MPDKFNFIREETDALRRAGLFIRPPIVDSSPGAWMTVDGEKVLNFCTDNYLGLAVHPNVLKAAHRALDRFGAGTTAGRSIAGTLTIHAELERQVAAFKDVEDALYVQSGLCANQAAIPPLAGREDVIFADELNHPSVVDGCRLGGASIIVYKHCDPDDLAGKVVGNLRRYRRGLAITDGVFPMDGNVAPLDEIYGVADRHGLITIVDDAHGEGVLGRGGRGIVDHFGLQGKFDLEIGTFSKAFGASGGIIAGRKLVVDYLRQKARAFLFSTAAAAADAAACLAAVQVLCRSGELVARLWGNTRYFRDSLEKLGFDTGNSATPIIPVMLGEAELAEEFGRRLLDQRVFTTAIGFPTVPLGLARIRVTISAMHGRDDLDYGLERFARVGAELGAI